MKNPHAKIMRTPWAIHQAFPSSAKLSAMFVCFVVLLSLMGKELCVGVKLKVSSWKCQGEFVTQNLFASGLTQNQNSELVFKVTKQDSFSTRELIT
jgi:hypothetical protein